MGELRYSLSAIPPWRVQLQSEYDEWQIGWVLPPNPSPSLIQEMGNNITSRLMNNLLGNAIHGAFLDSCDHHCGGWDSIGIAGKTQSTAFPIWYANVGNSSPDDQRLWIAGQAYPCASCCSDKVPRGSVDVWYS